MYRHLKKPATGSNHTMTRPDTRYNRSDPPNLILPKSDRFLKSISYTGPKLWATLPKDLKDINDLDRFKSEMRRKVDVEFSQLQSV